MVTLPERSIVPYSRLLVVSRFLFAVYAAALLLLYLASLPGYFENVTLGTVPDVLFVLNEPTGNDWFINNAQAAGLSINHWLIANTLTSFFILAIHYLTAGLIFWRLPQSWFALLSSFVITIIGTSVMINPLQASTLAAVLGTWPYFVFSLGAVVWPILPIWLYLFPDGRAVPRWPRWPIGILMGLFLIFQLVGILNTANLVPEATWAMFLSLNDRVDAIPLLVLPALVLALGSQVYRFWYVSGPVQKQQTKWFLFSIGLFIITFFIPEEWSFVSRLDAIEDSIFLVILPITIAIALLRYRLWDVDVVIRRTTSYAVLTGLLLLVYFASIVILQRVLAPFTGDSNPAVVASTLLIAALFFPLRRRVQATIDRRFFRQKYDAEKVLNAFSATVRDETDLDALTAELKRVIQETMQPEFVDIMFFESSSEIAALGTQVPSMRQGSE